MGQKLLELWQNHSGTVFEAGRKLLAAAFIVAAGLAVAKGKRKLVRMAQAKGMPVDGSISALIQTTVSYGAFIVCIIMILNVFGVNTSSLLALLGAAGVAVGLALKDTLGNIAAGIVLLSLGSYRIGEFVEFGSFMGTVKEINLFATIMETPDGVYISAPNSAVWANPLRNYTRNGKRRMEISASIALNDSVDTAFQVMQDIADEEPRFLQNPAPQIILHEIRDSSIRITIRAWAAVGDYWNVYWDLSRLVKEKMEEAGLYLPAPRRELRIVNESRET